MAILAIPYVPVYLVEHVGGGWIVHAAGGYVANTLIPASIVSAFSEAGAVLGSVAAGAETVASSPIAIAAGIAVVAAGTYCYFYGIPAPIETILANAGLGGKGMAAKGALLPTAAHGAFAVSAANLTTALILLGLAGYVAYHFYEKHSDAAHTMVEGPVIDAESVSRSYFGSNVWEQFGEPLSQGLSEASSKAVSFVKNAATATSGYADWLAKSVSDFAAQSTEHLEAIWNALSGRLLALKGKAENESSPKND